LGRRDADLAGPGAQGVNVASAPISAPCVAGVIILETRTGNGGIVLVRKMAKKSSHAKEWKEWLAANGTRLLLFARSWGDSKQDAEDLLQDAVLRLWNYQQERGGGPPDLPLAFNTIRFCGLNHARSERRRKHREHAVIYLEDFREDWLDPGIEENEEASLLREAIKDLPAKLGEVVTMKIWGGLTFAKIAETLKISPNTAASRYRYALEQLAGHLESVRKARHEVR